MDNSPALELWKSAQGISRNLTKSDEIFVRELHGIGESYRSDQLGSFFERVYGGKPIDSYLTQGLILPTQTWFARWIMRKRVPAILFPLAQDLKLPEALLPTNQLWECCLWASAGKQVTRLHFDEPENLHLAILGNKRWILYPWENTHNLGEGRGSVFEIDFETLHQLGKVPKGGFETVTKPGQLLYLPSGCAHQVWADEGPSISVALWYLPKEWDLLNRLALARYARDLGVRKCHTAKYRARWLSLLFYLLIRLPLPRLPLKPLEVGPTSY